MSQEQAAEKNSPVIRIACRTGSECTELEYVVIPMTFDYANSLLRKVGLNVVLATEDRAFYRAAYFDWTPEFYPDLDLQLADFQEGQAAALVEALINGEWIKLPPDFGLSIAARTDTPTVCIGNDDIIWKAWTHHGDEQADTPSLPVTEIASIMAELTQLQLPNISINNTKRTRLIQLDKASE